MYLYTHPSPPKFAKPARASHYFSTREGRTKARRLALPNMSAPAPTSSDAQDAIELHSAAAAEEVVETLLAADEELRSDDAAKAAQDTLGAKRWTTTAQRRSVDSQAPRSQRQDHHARKRLGRSFDSSGRRAP